MMSEEEVRKRIAEEVAKARLEQSIKDWGKTWLLEALSHTAAMVGRGEFAPEAHQVGQMIAQQFLSPGNGQQEKTDEKKE